AIVRQFLREPDEAWGLVHRSVALGREHGFPLFTVLGAVVQHCAEWQRGELQTGLRNMQEALAAYRATGAQLFLPFFLACLAEGHLRVGKIQDGLQAVMEALQLSGTNLDSFWEAEIYRLKGELTLAQSSVQSRVLRAKSKQKAKDGEQKNL